jgi:hypothetical protein
VIRSSWVREKDVPVGVTETDPTPPFWKIYGVSEVLDPRGGVPVKEPSGMPVPNGVLEVSAHHLAVVVSGGLLNGPPVAATEKFTLRGGELEERVPPKS